MESAIDLDPDNDAADTETERAKRPGWRLLFSFTDRIHLFPLSLALFLSVASGIIIPVLAVLLGKIFGLFTDFGADKISGSELVNKVSVYGMALVGLGSASGLLNAGYFMIWLIFGELQAKSVRDKLFDGMLEKDMEWYDMRRNGVDSLISRLQA
jgi:ATP-binding cassette subfamily B (MDR/TAP) protein 1